MKTIQKTVVASVLALGLAGFAAAGNLAVVTTTQSLAAVAREVGGEFVTVSSLTKGYEDTHFIPPKPSLMRALQRADALVIQGLELEVGWIPVVLPGSRNPRIQPGTPGFIDASERVAVLDKATGPVDRSMGDVHPGGNPHYTTDPVALKAVASLLADRLGVLDRPHAATYAEHARQFGARMDEKLTGWTERLKPFAGRPVVSYHNNVAYLLARFGFKQFGFIEPRPGISPNARHMEELAAAMKTAGAKVILYQPYYSADLPRKLAAQVGGTAVLIPEHVGGVPEAKDLDSMFEGIVTALEKSL